MSAQTVYFATNRNVEKRAPLALGRRFQDDTGTLYRVGRAEVRRVGSPWTDLDDAYETRAATLYAEARPSARRAGRAGSSEMFEEMRAAMAEGGRDALIYLHGFAHAFPLTMKRAAELADAYAPSGGTAPLAFAFSWPSDGASLIGDGRWAYSNDRVDAERSGEAMARAAMRLTDFLEGVARERRCGGRIHLVAHSMGTWALRAAVREARRLAAENARPLRPVFDTAFLMGSDIEEDALGREQWLAPLLTLARRVHVYHADNDGALTLSDLKPNQGDRLGHYGPANMAALPDRVSAVDCAAVSDTPADEVRHQYYRLAPEVVEDVRAVLSGRAATDMPWRRPGEQPGRWRILRDETAREALARGVA